MVVLNKASVILALVHISVCYAQLLAKNYSKDPATFGIGAPDDEVDFSRHPCRRPCEENGKPMTCRYGFTANDYSTMSKACYDCPQKVSDCSRPQCVAADGNEKAVMTVNRQIPGPSIEVCLGDRIVVDVSNRMMAESMTIHWHGQHQRGTPFMDGVPMVSQCPIAAGDSFRYDFEAGNPGTMFWHAHSGPQQSDGLFGPLIVRQPDSENSVRELYDLDEHTILLNAWSHVSGREAYLFEYQDGLPTEPHTILINGFGPYGNDSKTASIPRPIFRVRKNSQFRFRAINADGSVCLIDITIDRHPLLVISADGADVKPVEVDAIRLTPGERFDFVINADREVGNYWIRVNGLGECATRQARQEAVLRYEGAPDAYPTEPIGYGIGFEPGRRVLNPLDKGSESPGAMCISCSLRSVEADDLSLKPKPDYRFYLPYDLNIVNAVPDYHRKDLYEYFQVAAPKRQTTAQINKISFKYPDFPLQTQPELIGPDYLCNVASAKCTVEQCSCPYTLEVKLNTTVELILIDEGAHNTAQRLSPPFPRSFQITLPMHMHGYSYRVVAMKKITNGTITAEQVRALDTAGQIERFLNNAPKKDVVNVPSGGYAVVRFRADNPGYWLLQSTYGKLLQNGMAMVFKVGEHEDFPAVPKDFPKCQYH